MKLKLSDFSQDHVKSACLIYTKVFHIVIQYMKNMNLFYLTEENIIHLLNRQRNALQ